MTWDDPGAQTKKQSLLDLSRKGLDLRSGGQTAVVNASIMAMSYQRGSKAFNKPIVVDVEIPLRNVPANGVAEAAAVECG